MPNDFDLPAPAMWPTLDRRIGERNATEPSSCAFDHLLRQQEMEGGKGDDAGVSDVADRLAAMYAGEIGIRPLSSSEAGFGPPASPSEPARQALPDGGPLSNETSDVADRLAAMYAGEIGMRPLSSSAAGFGPPASPSEPARQALPGGEFWSDEETLAGGTSPAGSTGSPLQEFHFGLDDEPMKLPRYGTEGDDVADPSGPKPHPSPAASIGLAISTHEPTWQALPDGEPWSDEETLAGETSPSGSTGSPLQEFDFGFDAEPMKFPRHGTEGDDVADPSAPKPHPSPAAGIGLADSGLGLHEVDFKFRDDAVKTPRSKISAMLEGLQTMLPRSGSRSPASPSPQEPTWHSDGRPRSCHEVLPGGTSLAGSPGPRLQEQGFRSKLRAMKPSRDRTVATLESLRTRIKNVL